MLLIGENIHVISKSVQNALLERDETFILDLIKKQAHLDYIDLNVGPAKNQMQNVLPWLCQLVEQNSNLKISFDTTNFDEMKAGLKTSKSPKNCLLNSTSADEEKLEKMTSLAADFGSSLIALTMNKQIGIPKSADDRLALAFEIIEKADEKGIENRKIFFDPLILPVNVAQDQAQEALNTIQMIKQSFEPEVMTTIGLSNISNGSPNELRPIINKVFLALAHGAGLNSAIINALDFDLINTVKMLEASNPKTSSDELCIKLSEMIKDFGQIEDITFDSQDFEQVKIIKTAKMLLNKEVYSHSFLNF